MTKEDEKVNKNTENISDKTVTEIDKKKFKAEEKATKSFRKVSN